MNILILGCGRVGARLACTLSQEHEVTVMDWNAAAFERLPSEFAGQTVVGNGIDVDILRAAGAAHTDVFLALTNGDNRNLLAAQIAAQLGAGRAVARVYDPVRCEIFSGQGIVTVSPTTAGAEKLFSMVTRGEDA